MGSEPLLRYHIRRLVEFLQFTCIRGNIHCSRLSFRNRNPALCNESRDDFVVIRDERFKIGLGLRHVAKFRLTECPSHDVRTSRVRHPGYHFDHPVTAGIVKQLMDCRRLDLLLSLGYEIIIFLLHVVLNEHPEVTSVLFNCFQDSLFGFLPVCICDAAGLYISHIQLRLI